MLVYKITGSSILKNPPSDMSTKFSTADFVRELEDLMKKNGISNLTAQLIIKSEGE